MANCKHCRAKNAPIKINMNSFCNFDCAVSYGKDAARKKKDKEASKRIADQRKADRAKLDSLKTQREWASECQDVFNKMRRLEELLWFKEQGLEPTCISCQKPLGNDIWSCGHYKTRGARSDLAFDRNNTFLQHLVNCNKQKSGDIGNYQIGLSARFGEERAREIIEYCEIRQPLIKRTPEEWRALKAEWNREIRRLQSLL